MWLSEIKRKSEANDMLPRICANAQGDIILETASARICVKNSGEILLEGTIKINGSAIQ